MAELKTIELPEPVKSGSMPLEEAIFNRRSQRSFVDKDLDLAQIGQLLWSCQGITSKKWGVGFRAAPSAGALYPLEIYVVSKNGLWHYLPSEHKLEVLLNTDLRNSLAKACFDQDTVSQAPVDIVICAVYRRITGKYSQRGRRYVHIEVGHAAQNVHLEAVAMGLGSVPIGAFEDEQVKKVLALDPEEEPLYVIPVGYFE